MDHANFPNDSQEEVDPNVSFRLKTYWIVMCFGNAVRSQVQAGIIVTNLGEFIGAANVGRAFMLTMVIKTALKFPKVFRIRAQSKKFVKGQVYCVLIVMVQVKAVFSVRFQVATKNFLMVQVETGAIVMVLVEIKTIY